MTKQSEKERQIDQRIREAGIDEELSKANAPPANPLTRGAGPVLKTDPGGPEPHEAIKDRKDEHPMREVTFIQGYFPASGEKIPKGATRKLQIEDARHLIESNIAVLTDDLDAKG